MNNSKYIKSWRENIRKTVFKIRESIYGVLILTICMVVITGYISTIVIEKGSKEVFTGIAIIELLMGTGTIIMALVEAKKHQRPLIVILNLLLMISIYASVFCSIYAYDNSAFELSKQEIIYLDFLYYSFVTFTTAGYGDIVPASYLAKFTSASESFMFVCVISIAILNFSKSLDAYLGNREK